MNVADMIADVRRREGGYVDNAADRGGPTNMGITQKTLAAWVGRPVSALDVQNMSVETADAIYQHAFYDEPRIAILPDEVQPVVFDTAVNCGPPRAIRFVQSVINQAGFGPVAEDGKLGAETGDAAAKAQAAMGPFFCNAIVDERLAFYDRLAQADPSQQRFLAGWTSRANSFRLPT